MAKVGKAFGFPVPPKVNISVGSIKNKKGKEVDADSDDEGDGGVPRRAYYKKRQKD